MHYILYIIYYILYIILHVQAHYEDDMMARGLLDAKMDAVPDVPGQTVVDRIDS